MSSLISIVKPALSLHNKSNGKTAFPMVLDEIHQDAIKEDHPILFHGQPSVFHYYVS